MRQKKSGVWLTVQGYAFRVAGLVFDFPHSAFRIRMALTPDTRNKEMTEALILMGGMGLIISATLAVASKAFYVYVDPKIISVEEELPGAN